MNALNRLEKSKGVVLLATNTDSVDYHAIAGRCEQLIEHYLKLPVTIIDASTKVTNRRLSVDTNEYVAWNNSGRYRAYELSPYDQTILLDSDYLVFDDNLLKILDTVQDYNIVRYNNVLDGPSVDTIGPGGLNTLWATIISFNKTPKSKLLFDLVGRIERNYNYYRDLYNIQESNFRNDYAFTIADNILNGYTQDNRNYLPWPIYTISKPIQSLQLQGNNLLLKTESSTVVLPKQSIHIMSKEYLLSDAYNHLIKVATDA